MESVNISVVNIKIPEGCNIIVARSHFIKTVEDVYEAIVETNSSLKFGIAFNEASGDRLIRWDGNDKDLIDNAIKIAKDLSVGHLLVILIKNGWPVNIVPRLKQVSEVLEILVATANPLQAIIASTDQGNAILGFVDGFSPKGVEEERDINERKEFLRKIGYKR